MAAFGFFNSENHTFYNVHENELLDAQERLGFKFPKELREFYLEVGYGFIKSRNQNAFNRFLGPGTIADIRLREDIYELDPDLDGIYEEDDRLVFFEVNEGVYLTLDLNQASQTPVYYFETQIAGSLKEFISKMDEDAEYFMHMVD